LIDHYEVGHILGVISDIGGETKDRYESEIRSNILEDGEKINRCYERFVQ
jgi:hypothetical protein